MALDEVLDPLRRADQIVHIEHGHPALAAAEVDARDFEVGLVDDELVKLPIVPLIGEDKRLDQQQPAGVEVARHRAGGFLQALDRPGVGDRAEQAGHHVEALPQVKTGHIALVQGEIGEVLPRDGQHALVQLDAFEVGDAPAQEGEVLAGAAGHVKQAGGGRAPVGVDQGEESSDFVFVVFPPVDRIVKPRGSVVHWPLLAALLRLGVVYSDRAGVSRWVEAFQGHSPPIIGLARRAQRHIIRGGM